MGDLKKFPKDPPPTLPPGFRFHPSEHQLFSFYLCNKNKQQNPNLIIPCSENNNNNNNTLLGFDFIREIDLYNFDPCDLPEVSSFSFGHGGSKKHWYCFTVRKKMMVMGCDDSKRKGRGGFWKSKGRPRNVMAGGGGGDGGTALGTKCTFVFYRGNSCRSSNRTNWVMIEYALVDNHKDSFVLCRVYLKSEGIKRADPVPRAPCKKRDAPSISGIGEVVAHEDVLVDKENKIEKFPSKFTGEANDVVVAQRVSDDAFGPSGGIPQSDPLVNSNGLISSGIIFNDFMVDDLLTNSTILEGDFIELDDLVFPLMGIDSSD